MSKEIVVVLKFNKSTDPAELNRWIATATIGGEAREADGCTATQAIGRLLARNRGVLDLNPLEPDPTL